MTTTKDILGREGERILGKDSRSRAGKGRYNNEIYRGGERT